MGYTPTEAIVNNSLKGLALLEKHNSIKAQHQRQQLEPVAKSLQGEMDLTQVTSLYFKLLKAREQYQPKHLLEGYNVTTDTASFLALGGNAALDWCKAIVNKSTEDSTKVNTEDDIPGVPLQVTKAVEPLLKQVTYVAMKEGVDLHGDYVDLETIRLAKESFNRQLHKARMSNLFHLVETDSFDIIESFLAPCQMSLNGNFVQKGEWLVTLQILDDTLFDMIMNDEITGVSIGALAKTLNVED